MEWYAKHDLSEYHIFKKCTFFKRTSNEQQFDHNIAMQAKIDRRWQHNAQFTSPAPNNQGTHPKIWQSHLPFLLHPKVSVLNVVSHFNPVHFHYSVTAAVTE